MSRTLSLEGLNVIPALLELQMQPEQDENHENWFESHGAPETTKNRG
ncbi:hypothetical protein HMPREF9003_0405 [Bifidobacterium dentium JCVIHMP022]|uniref:Uncharacterized protein n=1 Tax=Bifidobacterium dentium JCVIHMP022 TaxID=553191 RepID=A0AB72Z2V6_9BIFI|nr:hypothetical protein HMPREF9003_0405 [Bifidobacterium dentium JCVIHMP022]